VLCAVGTNETRRPGQTIEQNRERIAVLKVSDLEFPLRFCSTATFAVLNFVFEVRRSHALACASSQRIA